MKFFNEMLENVVNQEQLSFNFRLDKETYNYFSERFLFRQTDIIDCWKINCKMFPMLAEVARQAGTLDAGNIVIATRSKLLTEKIKELCFLYSNLKIN